MKPTTMELQDLQHLIASRLDITEFLDIIGYSMYDVVEKFPEEIEEHFEELLKAVNG